MTKIESSIESKTELSETERQVLFADAMIRTWNGIFYIANDSVEPHKRLHFIKIPAVSGNYGSVDMPAILKRSEATKAVRNNNAFGIPDW